MRVHPGPRPWADLIRAADSGGRIGPMDTHVQTLTERLAQIVGDRHLLTGDAISDDYGHDEALTVTAQRPAYVAKPATAEQVAELLTTAGEYRLPVTARGSGTGLSGAARPQAGGLVISFERMNAILEVDEINQVAVVQPGVTLAELDAGTAAAGLSYTVYPGELSASVGGNVGTNAGGMRAVKYGVTRHNVLGLQAVLPSGDIIRTGGKIAKVSSGYDLTQLIIGSEGTLALVTEVIVKLHPRLAFSTTVLAPFGDIGQMMAAVPKVLASGVGPTILEYLDTMTMGAIVSSQHLELGVPEHVRQACEAYLVVALDNRDEARLREDAERLGELLAGLGAVDIYLLEGSSARTMIEAREKAFWAAKAMGVDDVVDVVIPRAAMPEFLDRCRGMALEIGANVLGCGHAGDGNVHLGIFCKDPAARTALLTGIFTAAMELGGAISGEHGLGCAKADYFLALEDPAKVELMRAIKKSFDPVGILNPGLLYG
jgi:glycolate oxidase